MIASPKRVLVDTSTLVSLAVDRKVQQQVEVILHGRVSTALIVRDELKNLHSNADAGQFANQATKNIGWLGQFIALSGDQELFEVERVRTLVKAGKPLRHPGEHMGESALIVLSKTLETAILMEDYDARMIAKSEGVVALSLHRALHHWIHEKVMSPIEAKEIADILKVNKRGSDYTIDELTLGGPKRMGRVWYPEY